MPAGGSAGGLGVDQTWQDVAASRAHSTIYQNTTGKPIEVHIFASTTTGRPIEVSPDNVTWTRAGFCQNGTTVPNAFTVLNGHYYRINGSVGTIVAWTELR